MQQLSTHAKKGGDVEDNLRSDARTRKRNAERKEALFLNQKRIQMKRKEAEAEEEVAERQDEKE